MPNNQRATAKSRPGKKYQREYFRVTITYTDNEISGRVFKVRESAEKFATRQKKSPAVKKTKVEAFIKDRHAWHAAQRKRTEKTR